MTGGGLRSAFASADSKSRYVRRLFATIADRYDLITVLLSYGRDRAWKARVADLADAGPATSALDLACGTGDIAFAMAARGARVVGLDITHRMVELARMKRTADPHASFLTGDMMHLPFQGASFDVVTTGYGLRNVPEITTALHEIHRVLTPGGLMVSLDFNRPENAIVRTLYLGYLAAIGSALGLILHKDPDTYRYIPESIRRYPGAGRIADMIRHAGFSSVAVYPVLGGLMAIHRARK